MGAEFHDKRKMKKQELVEKIKEESKASLLPNLQSKMADTTNHIVTLLQEKGEDKVSNIQIMSMIAKKSISEIAMAGTNIGYTSEEIACGFDLYLDMINKINEIKKFPPTVESFCNFMGVSRSTYNNWCVDPEKRNILDYINSYILGVYSVGGMTGDLKEISSMFQSKCMGKTEASVPQVVKHEITTNLDEINKQLEALKQDNIISDAEYEEVE